MHNHRNSVTKYIALTPIMKGIFKSQYDAFKFI